MEKITYQNFGIENAEEPFIESSITEEVFGEIEITQEDLTIEPIILEPVVIDFSLNKDE